MKRRRLLIWLGTIATAGVFLGIGAGLALRLAATRPYRAAITQNLGAALTLRSPLSLWQMKLGAPTAYGTGLGGEPDLFVWPERGVAVFTHPLFEAQHRRRALADRKVTSIFFALRTEVQAPIDPRSGRRLSFARLPRVPFGDVDLATLPSLDFDALKRLVGSVRPVREDVFAIGSQVSAIVAGMDTRVIMRDGQAEWLEFREASVLSWYD